MVSDQSVPKTKPIIWTESLWECILQHGPDVESGAERMGSQICDEGWVFFLDYGLDGSENMNRLSWEELKPELSELR